MHGVGLYTQPFAFALGLLLALCLTVPTCLWRTLVRPGGHKTIDVQARSDAGHDVQWRRSLAERESTGARGRRTRHALATRKGGYRRRNGGRR
eukprot:scaffold1327_cov135-Isochrysis_galbana.AAC.2